MSEGQGNGGRTITKADLVQSVHEKVGFSKKESAEIVERVFESMKRTLEGGEDLKISGFGKFDVRRKNARRGRNPKTEEGLIIPARTVVTFKASQVLKHRVAGDEARSVSTIEQAVDAAARDDEGDEEFDDDDDDDEHAVEAGGSGAGNDDEGSNR
jgi:integration host factor subunit alpha